MVIYLPLLFAEGQPTSLEQFTQEQLERFIPFMLSCCSCNKLEIPVWWPDSVPFQFPLFSIQKRPQITALREIVCRCYEYYKCEHVLRFCARLSEVVPGTLHYKDEPGGYVSIYNKTNQLIVKFKKKNQTYDAVISSPHKSLLPRKPQPANPNPVIEDIYLCNYCDEEFTNVREAVGHEAVCKGKANEEIQGAQAVDQVSVMGYFGLCRSAELREQPKFSSKRGTSLRLTSKSFSSIPISSPLGVKLAMNITLLDDSTKLDYIKKVEKYCAMKMNSAEVNKARRTRKICGPLSTRSRRNPLVWAHTYCFNRKQREEKSLIWQTGLNKKSRNLLKLCRPASIVIKRLPLLDPLALHAAARLLYMRDSEGNSHRSETFSSVKDQGKLSHQREEPIVIDLCSSESEDGDDDNLISDQESRNTNHRLTCVDREKYESSNTSLLNISPRICKLSPMHDSDGPQYGVSARSAVPSLPLLMPATAEAEVPSLSSSPNWLSSSSHSPCDSVCVNTSSQTMVPLRQIRI